MKRHDAEAASLKLAETKVVIDAIGVSAAAGNGKLNLSGTQGRPTKALISATLAAQRAKGGSVADDDMAWLG